jgi:hypothetical protein
VKPRARWTEPEPAVTGFFPSCSSAVRRVLDVGTGIGRRAFGVRSRRIQGGRRRRQRHRARATARRGGSRGLSIEAHLAAFTDLPIDDASVDHVLAWNVLYHGDAASYTQRSPSANVLRVEGPRS